jgi:glycosyltransferase involved in cell wall biosynthesis
MIPLRINLVTWDNGGGLRTDVDVLTDLLSACGCEILFNGRSTRSASGTWRSDGLRVRVRHGVAAVTARRSYDVNLFLESIAPEFLPHARINCLVPNPEWFRDENRPYLPQIDWVLCKTRSAVDAFQPLTTRTRYVGFRSPDRSDAHHRPDDDLLFLHASGSSRWKGTAAVIAVWRRHPGWPRLVVLRSRTLYGGEAVEELSPAPNIDVVTEWLDDAAWRRYQNACAVHLCPSEAEGFGHLILESMSCGAVVITTDGAPMNEMVTPDRGVLVRAARYEPMHLATRYFVDPDDLERQVARLIAMSPDERRLLGERARRWYEHQYVSCAESWSRFITEQQSALQAPLVRPQLR